MRALSIRQPFAELILRGITTVEFRSRATRIVGERFYIYASKGKGAVGSGQWSSDNGIWSHDLSAQHPPQAMMELWEMLRAGELPSGVIVGSAVISHCTPLATDDGRRPPLYQWHLSGVERIARPRKPTGHPQPVWFKPF